MTTIKKTISSLLILLFIAGASLAQKNKKEKEVTKDENKYKKLQEYYDAGKYADCIWKAEKWMDNEKYQKDPELYMYTSMSYLGVYKDPDAFPIKKFPDFKNPLKDAMLNFVKFKKHDKKGEVLAENKTFADELRNAVIEQSLDLHEKKDISHLTTIARDIIKTFDKDDVMLMLGGSYMLMTNNLADGMKATDSSMVSLTKKALGEKPQYTDNEQKALNDGFIVYTDFLLSKKNNAKAKDAINVANVLLTPNDKLKTQTDKIEKSLPAAK